MKGALILFNYIKKPSIQHNQEKVDPYVTTLVEWIDQDIQPNIDYDFSFIGIPISKSSISFSGAHLNPDSFRQLWSSFTTYSLDDDIDLVSLNSVDLGNVKMHITDIKKCHQNIERAMYEVKQQFKKTTLINIGGDHSITFPIIKGLKNETEKEIGLIHFDAHLDVRDTSYGGHSNGTPIRNLIETSTIKGDNIISIGLRNFANSKEYRDYAVEKGMTLYTANQVHHQGIASILERSIANLNDKCDEIYVTFDIDVMDQSFVPGVPAIGPGGLNPLDVFYSANELGKLDKVIGIDIVCNDPTKDLRDVTARVALHIFLNFAKGYYFRKGSEDKKI